jgi:hypothetical protein
LLSTAAQFCFLVLAAVLGFQKESIWWLIPLTVCLGVVGWLTDRHWKIRFYDIYNVRDWTKFWAETLFGLAMIVFAAYVAGQMAGRLAEYAG